MAYMNGDKGPYPNKAGDYCGNHLKGSKALSLKAWLLRMRFGRPRPCKAGTTEEMEAKGFVGLYLKQDRTLRPDEGTEIPTPPELQEPPVNPARRPTD